MSLRQQSLRSKYFTKRPVDDASVEGGSLGRERDVEDVEGDDSSVDDSYDSSINRSRSRRSNSKGFMAVIFQYKNYILIMLLIILGISYLHERSVRIQAVKEFNEKFTERSLQNVYKSSTSSKGSNPIIACPKCPQCSNDDTPEVTEREEAEDVPQADPLEHVRKWDEKHLVLTQEIQRLSRSLLQLKFGSPPYYVELELEVDSETVKGGKITIEMAPTELMPYSVYFFMTQVTAGVWNSCSFFINLGVVYYDEARGSDRCKKEDFATVDGIGETMAFQEYSDKYQHLTDTIGINGRPAGKGFYFNAQNNTRTLRPRGTRLPGGLPLEGDPCVGKIVRGMDTYISIKKLEHLNDEGESQLLSPDILAFQKTVSIVSAKVVKEIDNA